MNYEELMQKAKEVSKNAYVLYSHFPVGACLLTDSGKVFSGCNFENSSYGLTICAERNAAGSAIAEGEKCFKAIAIYSPKMNNCFPCGACRQVLHEFQPAEGLDVILEDENGLNIFKLNDIFPDGFKL